MGSCNCGGSRTGGTGRKFQLIGQDGIVIRTYDREMEARQAASQESGTRVRPV